MKDQPDERPPLFGDYFIPKPFSSYKYVNEPLTNKPLVLDFQCGLERGLLRYYIFVSERVNVWFSSLLCGVTAREE